MYAFLGRPKADAIIIGIISMKDTILVFYPRSNYSYMFAFFGYIVKVIL